MIQKSLILICGIALLGMAAGCNVVGYAANAAAGGSSTPATFTMAKKPTVVVAENFSNPAEAAINSEPLARYVTEDLKAENVAPMVDPSRIDMIRNDHPEQWKTLTIAAVGREVGADQILYIDIIHADVEVADASDLLRGRGEVRVRLIDTKTGASIWPIDSEGFEITAETKYGSQRAAAESESNVRAALLRAIAAKISVLFYTVSHD